MQNPPFCTPKPTVLQRNNHCFVTHWHTDYYATTALLKIVYMFKPLKSTL